MRFGITVENVTKQLVPINYQYPLSAWIYKVFNNADEVFSEWLHNYGYAFNGDRKFKLFTFSGIEFSQARLINMAESNIFLEVPSGRHKISLSFYMEEAASNFITGLFRKQELVLAEKGFKAEFQITAVEKIPEPNFKHKMEFQCLSPIVVTIPEMQNEKLRATYLAPDYHNYSELIKENLVKRYVAAHNKVLEGVNYTNKHEEYLVDLPFDIDKWDFKVISKPKSKLQTIKSGTEAQTKVRGFVFDFELTAPVELMKFLYYSGIGEKGSLGFGCVGVR